MSRSTAIFILVAIMVLVIALVVGVALAITKAGVDHQSLPSASSVTLDSTPPPLPPPPAAPVVHRKIGIQKFNPTSRTAHLQVLDYRYFTVGYDNARRNPAWVTYDLDGPITHSGKAAKRPMVFATDDRTSAKVKHHDYSNSGFDRGHMCPAYAMFSRYGIEGERATFICTNIIPQSHEINAGLWENLEERIAGRSGKNQGWAGTLRHITVINGPVYRGTKIALPSGVEVPDLYFSIVFDYLEDAGAYRALAFEIPRTLPPPTSMFTLDNFEVSIKHIEDDTGLDVFAGVDPEVRAETENVALTARWP